MRNVHVYKRGFAECGVQAVGKQVNNISTASQQTFCFRKMKI